jgi:RNA polymerase sigma-70 factor (ECF subfamily)
VARRQKVAAKPVESLEAVADSAGEPFAVLTTLERQSLVRESLGQIPADDREILVLRYALEWSSQRIAEKLEITAAAVDMRLSRARKRLGTILQKAGVRPE